MMHPIWGQIARPFIGWIGPYQWGTNGILYMPLTDAIAVSSETFAHFFWPFQWVSYVPVVPLLP